MSDQCRYCELMGDIDQCLMAECFHHENWYAKTLQKQLEKKDNELLIRDDYAAKLEAGMKMRADEITELKKKRTKGEINEAYARTIEKNKEELIQLKLKVNKYKTRLDARKFADNKLIAALEEIANQDYRGCRSSESQIAHIALSLRVK